MNHTKQPRAGKRPLGRRPNGVDTREEILAAARASFAAHGFDRSTIRGIASEADVDPSLVLHYFASKEKLFVATLKLPSTPDSLLREATATDPSRIGVSIAHAFFETWEEPERRETLTVMLRSIMSNEAAMTATTTFMEEHIVEVASGILEIKDADLRATLVISHLMGIAILRYITHIEPLASAPTDQLISAVGATIQRYFTADLERA